MFFKILNNKIPVELLIVCLIVILMPFQQLSVRTFFTDIRLYMVLVPISSLFVILVRLNTNYKINLMPIDAALFIFYFYMCLTSLWSPDIRLATLRFFGIILLLTFYLNVSLLRGTFNRNELLSLFSLAGKIFFLSSFIYYALGIFDFIKFGSNELSAITNPHYLLKGVYIEAGSLPRLRGVSDSPNNFVAYSAFFCILFYLVSDKIWYYLGLFQIILTFSFTAYIVLIILVIFRLKVRYLFFLFFLFLSTFPVFSIFSSLDFSFIIHKLTTGSGRYDLFARSFDFYSNSPMIGFGLNSPRLFNLDNVRELQSTHNNFLEIMFEGGVIALILYILLHLNFLYNLLKIRNDKFIFNLYFYNLIVIFILSMSNSTLYSDGTFYVISFINALISKNIKNSV